MLSTCMCAGDSGAQHTFSVRNTLLAATIARLQGAAGLEVAAHLHNHAIIAAKPARRSNARSMKRARGHHGKLSHAVCKGQRGRPSAADGQLKRVPMHTASTVKTPESYTTAVKGDTVMR